METTPIQGALKALSKEQKALEARVEEFIKKESAAFKELTGVSVGNIYLDFNHGAYPKAKVKLNHGLN